MRLERLMRRALMPFLAFAALCVLASCCATDCLAGILLPQQISFDADDLERFLEPGDSTSAGASSAPVRRHIQEWPVDNSDRPTERLELANSLPTGTTSSSTTSSSPGGAIGFGVVQCVLNSTLTLNDESPVGSLADDHGFTLPDPLGTDLLRPPRV